MTLLLFLWCASISKVLVIWHQPSLPLFEHCMVWMHFFTSTTISSQIGNKHNYWKNPGLNDFEPSWDSNPWQLHLKFLCNTFFLCSRQSVFACNSRVYIFCYHIRSSISNLRQKIQNLNKLISSNSNLNPFSCFWQSFEYCINLNVLSHWQYFCFMMKLYFVTGKSKTGPILDFLVATLHWKEIEPLFSFIVREKNQSHILWMGLHTYEFPFTR